MHKIFDSSRWQCQPPGNLATTPRAARLNPRFNSITLWRLGPVWAPRITPKKDSDKVTHTLRKKKGKYKIQLWILSKAPKKTQECSVTLCFFFGAEGIWIFAKLHLTDAWMGPPHSWGAPQGPPLQQRCARKVTLKNICSKKTCDQKSDSHASHSNGFVHIAVPPPCLQSHSAPRNAMGLPMVPLSDGWSKSHWWGHVHPQVIPTFQGFHGISRFFQGINLASTCIEHKILSEAAWVPKVMAGPKAPQETKRIRKQKRSWQPVSLALSICVWAAPFSSFEFGSALRANRSSTTFLCPWV